MAIKYILLLIKKIPSLLVITQTIRGKTLLLMIYVKFKHFEFDNFKCQNSNNCDIVYFIH
jgi:hypothetical protein